MNTSQTEVDLSADYIDVRDIIARVEELREERVELFDVREAAEAEGAEAEFAMADVKLTNWDNENGEELHSLEAILREIAGRGGDERWEGVWYPVTLIRESYFETAMDDLLEDIGDLPENLPGYLTITIDYDALRMDYTSVEIDGTDYWYR